ncbi:hypothetical protein BG20_I0574 [Candidatus Nitrosarchaeum limnium BG20]|uniref:Uncharacterized protein n=1 Tax=Candidatus Nitrosarchaeum limnium BG20 TaxID=859192 RepID=S2E4S6_9ARCH|nr:hypothetical protein BG20_I0574 [Candidatus Nitrosarchaeum limnium BG20]
MLATTIMPKGSCAFDLTYIFPNIEIRIPSITIFTIETTDKIRELDSI